MTTELRTAIESKGSLIEGLSERFFYLEAPQKVSFPYSVFSFVTNLPTRDSASKFEDYYLQINLYDKNGIRIELIKERFINEFDDSEASFSLPSYHFDRIERQFAKPLKVDKVFQISFQYKIELTKK